MSTLRIWCSDIYPESVRVAISRLLGNNWSQLSSMELTVPDICQYWYMVVLLIQDIEVNVRLSMCRSIYELIIKNRGQYSYYSNNYYRCIILCRSFTNIFMSSIYITRANKTGSNTIQYWYSSICTAISLKN